MRCGVITSRPRPDAAYDRSLDVILLGFGTILDQGETLSSPRVINTAGPGTTVSFHAFLEQHDARLDGFPNAKHFIELANAVDPSQRHLALHSGHLTELNAIDRQVITGEALSIAPLVCRPAELPERLAGLAGQGITEVAFQPMATSPASCRRSRMQPGFRRWPEQSSMLATSPRPRRPATSGVGPPLWARKSWRRSRWWGPQPAPCSPPCHALLSSQQKVTRENAGKR